MIDSDQQPKDAAVIAQIIELVHKITKIQRRALLKMLEEWHYTKRREHPRKPCALAVDYAAGDRALHGVTTDISAGGVFIETRGPLSVGQEITMIFSSSNYPEPIKITGEVVRRGTLGVGVKFKTTDHKLEAMIKSLS